MTICRNTRRRPWRLVAAASAAALTAGLLTAATATAGATEPAERGTDRDLVTELTTMTLGGKLVLDPSARKAEVVSLRAISQLVDDAGKALGPKRTARLNARAGAGPAASFACVKRGKTGKHFTAWRPAEIFSESRVGTQQYLYFPYMHSRARDIAGGPSVQYEICATGGADLRDGWRIRQAGTGMALADAHRTYKIGQRWRSGRTPESYTLGLGFQLSDSRVPISINGSISQNPSDSLLGSITGPYPTFMDAYARNGVNACPCRHRRG